MDKKHISIFPWQPQQQKDDLLPYPNFDFNKVLNALANIWILSLTASNKLSACAAFIPGSTFICFLQERADIYYHR